VNGTNVILALVLAVLSAGLLPLGASGPRVLSWLAADCDPLEGPDLQPRFTGIGGVGTNAGLFEYDSKDLVVATGLAGMFNRSYFGGSELKGSSLGPGFASLFDARLRTDINRASDMLFFLPGRGAERFVGAADLGYGRGRNRTYREILKQPDLKWVVRDADRTWTFGTTGELLEVRSVDGDWLKLRYESWRHVEAIGPGGSTLGIDWENDLVARVRDLAREDRFVDYRYDTLRRLESVTSSSGAGERFEYESDSHRLVTISDGSGRVLLKLEYDDRERVVRELDSVGLRDGQAVTYEYIERPNGHVETIVRYPPSRIEPAWHPSERHVSDERGYLIELEARPTSTIVAIGSYGRGPQGDRAIIRDPCAGLAFIPRAAPPERRMNMAERVVFLLAKVWMTMAGLVPARG
jgi:hypothetical protein